MEIRIRSIQQKMAASGTQISAENRIFQNWDDHNPQKWELRVSQIRDPDHLVKNEEYRTADIRCCCDADYVCNLEFQGFNR